MALVDVFEPGSVNKIITAAAALESGAITPSTVLAVPDQLPLASDAIFSDAESHKVQNWNLSDILTQSSNVGTIMVAQKMKPTVLDHYLRSFGLGQTTGVGLRNESSGLLPDVDTWTKSSMGSIPIGQGVAVTAMQMLEAMNVIASGGSYVTPTLVKATITPDGTRLPAAPTERRPVISHSTAAIMQEILQRVVTEGTGKQAAIPGYTVAGKTGTARKPQDTGTYLDKDGNYHYVSSFAGFAPTDHPQISAIVVIDEPPTVSSDYYAGQVAAPLFAKVVAEALRDFDVPPSPVMPGG
jgi:cell division protein FtsI (penicillin-binding protein 3)